jgi:hypothetical protein
MGIIRNTEIKRAVNIATTVFYKKITPWSRGLLEKLTYFQLVKKFPAFCGNRRFITAFTTAYHLSLP